jgi:hypothetical protein
MLDDFPVDRAFPRLHLSPPANMAAEKVDLSLLQRLQHLKPMLLFIMAFVSLFLPHITLAD